VSLNWFFLKSCWPIDTSFPKWTKQTNWKQFSPVWLFAGTLHFDLQSDRLECCKHAVCQHVNINRFSWSVTNRGLPRWLVVSLQSCLSFPDWALSPSRLQHLSPKNSPIEHLLNQTVFRHCESDFFCPHMCLEKSNWLSSQLQGDWWMERCCINRCWKCHPTFAQKDIIVGLLLACNLCAAMLQLSCHTWFLSFQSVCHEHKGPSDCVDHAWAIFVAQKVFNPWLLKFGNSGVWFSLTQWTSENPINGKTLHKGPVAHVVVT